MLKVAGFEMPGSETEHWYARKYYNIDFRTSVY